MSVDFTQDRMEMENEFSNFEEYAEKLKKEVPELFSGEFKVITEFGYSASSKVGFLASRAEYIKGSDENPIMMVHFGADCCIRQVYTNEHHRRIEIYDGERGTLCQNDSSDIVKVSVGGPLCFQGDFVGTDLPFSKSAVKEGNIVVLKDVGSYTLTMFSIHCNRLCPPVYGYRQNSSGEVTEFKVIKPRQKIEQSLEFWSE